MVPDCTGTAQAGGRPLRPQGPVSDGSKVLLFYGYQMDQLGDDTSVPTTYGRRHRRRHYTYVRINRKYGYSQLARDHGSEKNVNNKQRP
ncbi:hypothetical protein CGCTS75_v011732 [Colletotrichum tropicale]|nr:hypothetical protein CGCTS75_v011732 [Colletotrichum tropicale]